MLQARLVGAQRDLRFAGVGAGLLQRQRQEPQQLSDLLGGGRLAAAGAGQQERHRLLGAEDLQLGQGGVVLPAGVAGGDQDLAVDHLGQQVRQPAQRRPQPAGTVGRGGVVEDQQAAVVVGQPAPDRGHGQLLVWLAGLGQAQRGAEFGQVADQGGGLLGADPPDGVELCAVPVGVLHRQGGLADPAGALEDLGDRRRPAWLERRGQGGQLLLAAGEGGVALEGQVPHRRQRGRKPRPLNRWGWCAGEARRGGRAAGAAQRCGDVVAQPGAGGGLVGADQVDPDPVGQQPRGLAVLDPHRQQPPRLAAGVGLEAGSPLRLGHLRAQVGRGEHQDGVVGRLDGLVHGVDERGPGGHVPGLQHGGIAGGLELPGQPLGPGPVGLGVADEEVALLVWLVHPARPARPG